MNAQVPAVQTLQESISGAITQIEAILATLTKDTAEWGDALARQRRYTKIYRHLWLTAELDIRQMQLAILDTTGIDLDVGNEVGEELNALSHRQTWF